MVVIIISKGNLGKGFARCPLQRQARVSSPLIQITSSNRSSHSGAWISVSRHTSYCTSRWYSWKHVYQAGVVLALCYVASRAWISNRLYALEQTCKRKGNRGATNVLRFLVTRAFLINGFTLWIRINGRAESFNTIHPVLAVVWLQLNGNIVRVREAEKMLNLAI